VGERRLLTATQFYIYGGIESKGLDLAGQPVVTVEPLYEHS
jgi:hypothetical protein